MAAGTGLESGWAEGLEVGSGRARLEALRFAWWRLVEKKGGIFTGVTAKTTGGDDDDDGKGAERAGSWGFVLLPERAGSRCVNYASHRGHGRSKDMAGALGESGWMCKLLHAEGFPTLHSGRKASAKEHSMAGALIRPGVETGCGGAVRLAGLGMLFCC